MELKSPLVSVIAPVYKVERFLEKCVISILEQDYKNIEVILVDDGSPDDSGKIADSFAKKDSRVRVIHKKNEGVATARNVGMDAASGEFILFVDSDDWISKDHVSHLMTIQAQNDSDMCMTTEFFTQKSDCQSSVEIIRTISNDQAAALLLSPKVVVGSYNKLYRRKWLETNNLRQNVSLFSGEGLHFIVTAAQHANHVTVSNRKIYYYRRNVQESATTKFNIKMFTNNELSLDLLEKNKVVNSELFDNMLSLFRVHLKINGILAVLTYSSPKTYPEEYCRWRKEIRKIGLPLLFSKYIPLKSKIRIISVIVAPYAWAYLARKKREKIFRGSV